MKLVLFIDDFVSLSQSSFLYLLSLHAAKIAMSGQYKENFSQTECEKCKKSNPRLTCSACKCSRYCSKECQTADWKAHKPACKRIAINKKMRKAPTISGRASALNATKSYIDEAINVCKTENQDSAFTITTSKRGNETRCRVFLKKALRRSDRLQLSPSDYLVLVHCQVAGNFEWMEFFNPKKTVEEQDRYWSLYLDAMWAHFIFVCV